MNSIYKIVEVITVIAAFFKLTWWAGIKFRDMFSSSIDAVKKKTKNTTFEKVLSLLNNFIPLILSVVALSIDMLLNRPFDTINFIMVSCFVTMILWNIILVVLFSKIESLEHNIHSTSSGLIKLTEELKKVEINIKEKESKLEQIKKDINDLDDMATLAYVNSNNPK